MSSRMIGKAGWMIDELKGCMQRLNAGPGWALGTGHWAERGGLPVPSTLAGINSSDLSPSSLSGRFKSRERTAGASASGAAGVS